MGKEQIPSGSAVICTPMPQPSRRVQRVGMTGLKGDAIGVACLAHCQVNLWFNVVNFCFDLALNHGDYRLFHYCIEKSADLITIATLLSFVITWCLRSHVRKPRIPEQLLKPFKGAGCLANPNKVDLVNFDADVGPVQIQK